MKRIVTAGLVLAIGTAAHAGITQLNFGYEGVNGIYNGTTTFSWSATTANSSGDVFVTSAPAKRADFALGSLGGANTADVTGSLTVGSITATTATGVGSITLTDADGSTITASVSGNFYLGAPPGSNDPTILFTGVLSSVVYTFADSTFDGDTSSFSTSDFNTNADQGFLTEFEFDGNWFTAGAFSTDTLQLDGSTRLPVPGAALLGILGLTAITSIRRRFAA